ncbi:MAG: Gfo/Idh/MocA family oxidoreductase [Henriciella sp.]
MKKPIRIGVVGLGKIARDQHLPSISKNTDFELAFLVDRAVTMDLGVPSFSSLTDALNSGVPFDAISICTSPQVRFELCEQLFELRPAILLEKPAASDYELARSIVDRAAKFNLCLFTTWHSRFAPQIETAKSWAKRHDVVSGEIEWCENVLKWHPGQDWIWREGGFGVFDPGMNALSILTAILPLDWTLGAAQIAIPQNVETPNTATFELHHKNTLVRSNFDFHANEREVWKISLQASDGSELVLSNGGAHLQIDGELAGVNEETCEYGRIYARFSQLCQTQQSDCDLAPLKIIADIFASATRISTAPIKI